MIREFHVGVTTDSKTGELMAVYFRVRRGRAARVKEFADGNALANYNKKGELLGIELLGPCNVKVLDRIAVKDDIKKFIRKAAPNTMLVGAGT